MSDDHFQPCSDDCVCKDYPQERGGCQLNEKQSFSCNVDCPIDCPCDDRDALQTFARSVDRLSAAVLLLGQMIDERIYGRDF